MNDANSDKAAKWDGILWAQIKHHEVYCQFPNQMAGNIRDYEIWQSFLIDFVNQHDISGYGFGFRVDRCTIIRTYWKGRTCCH